MAGILFTNEKLFLAGYKSFKGYITGIGGKQKKDESLFITAIRETLEELLGIDDVETFELELFENNIKPFKSFENNGYTHFCCSFLDLTLFLKFAFIIRKKSPFYDYFPSSLEQLLLERKNSEESEISHLTLLPCVQNIHIAKHLVEDINLYEKLASKM
jgi:8-oxo-dGTP pyrophosphatase MutT (NUDIX family)